MIWFGLIVVLGLGVVGAFLVYDREISDLSEAERIAEEIEIIDVTNT